MWKATPKLEGDLHNLQTDCAAADELAKLSSSKHNMRWCLVPVPSYKGTLAPILNRNAGLKYRP